MVEGIVLPSPPELNLDVMKLTNVEALKINSEIVRFLEGVRLAIADGEIRLKGLKDEVRKIKYQVTLEMLEELKVSGIKTNDDQRQAMLAVTLDKNVHYVAKSSSEEELEADLIRAKALLHSYQEYLAWYKDCLVTFNTAARSA